jgi:hypothetical protein
VSGLALPPCPHSDVRLEGKPAMTGSSWGASTTAQSLPTIASPGMRLALPGVIRYSCCIGLVPI